MKYKADDDDDYYSDQDGYQRSYFEKKKSLITPFKSKYQGLKSSLFQNYKTEQKQVQKEARVDYSRTQSYYRDLQDQYRQEEQQESCESQYEPYEKRRSCEINFTSIFKLLSLLLIIIWLYIIYSQYQLNFQKAIQQIELQKNLCSQNYEKYKCYFDYYPDMEKQCNQWQKCSKIDSQLQINKQKILVGILTDVPQFLSSIMTWQSNGFLILMVLFGLIFLRVLNALK